MRDTTILIPVIDINENILEYLNKAILSVKRAQQENTPQVMVIVPDTLDNVIFEQSYVNVLVNNTGKFDFASQINFGVTKVSTKYFTVLEFDDELSEAYFDNFKIFMEKYEASIYLPLIVELKDGQGLVKITNEFPWSKTFIEDDNFGYITNKQLQDFSYFYISGGLINTEDFVSVGMLKNKLDVTCVYEFLLRVTFNNKKVFVVPKIGYLHRIDRDGSATKTYAAKYDKNTIQEQYRLAKNEYIL